MDNEYRHIHDDSGVENVIAAQTDSEPLELVPSNDDREGNCNRSLLKFTHKNIAPSNPSIDESHDDHVAIPCFQDNDIDVYGESRDDVESHGNNVQHSRAERVAELEDELESLRRQFSQKIDRFKRRRLHDKKRAKWEARLEVQENCHELQEILENIENEMEKTIHQVRQDCQRHHELDLIVALDQERKRLKENHDKELKEVSRALREKVDEFVKANALNWEEYHRQQKQQQRQQQREYEEALLAQEQKLAQKFEANFQLRLKEKLEKQKQEILDQRPHTEEEVKGLLQSFDVAHQVQLKDLHIKYQETLQIKEQEHEKELEELFRMLQTNAGLLERSTVDMVAAIEAAEAQAAQNASRSQQKETQRIILNHNHTVEKLCQQHEESLQELRLAFELERLADREQAMQEKHNLVKQHQQHVERVSLDYEKKMEQLRALTQEAPADAYKDIPKRQIQNSFIEHGPLIRLKNSEEGSTRGESDFRVNNCRSKPGNHLVSRQTQSVNLDSNTVTMILEHQPGQAIRFENGISCFDSQLTANESQSLTVQQKQQTPAEKPRIASRSLHLIEEISPVGDTIEVEIKEKIEDRMKTTECTENHGSNTYRDAKPVEEFCMEMSSEANEVQSSVQPVLASQKAELGEVIRRLKIQLKDLSEYWEQQEMGWKRSLKQLEEQEVTSKLELKEYHEYELRVLQRTMDAAIVQAQADAVVFVRKGAQKLKDMQRKQDKLIEGAVQDALEKQKGSYEEVIYAKNVQLQDAIARWEELHASFESEVEARVKSLVKAGGDGNNVIASNYGGARNSTEECALSKQKSDFKRMLDAQKVLMEESAEYWHQQKMEWDETLKNLEEQSKQSQWELREHYEFELRSLQQTMEAAVVEAQEQAAIFVRSGLQKLKDMEREQDEKIDRAVQDALRQEKSFLGS